MAVTVMTKNRGKPLVTGLVGVSTITYKKRHMYVLLTKLNYRIICKKSGEGPKMYSC